MANSRHAWIDGMALRDARATIYSRRLITVLPAGASDRDNAARVPIPRCSIHPEGSNTMLRDLRYWRKSLASASGRSAIQAADENFSIVHTGKRWR